MCLKIKSKSHILYADSILVQRFEISISNRSSDPRFRIENAVQTWDLDAWKRIQGEISCLSGMPFGLAPAKADLHVMNNS